MRMWEIVAEEIKANTIGDNLKKQADAKADQAKKLKQAASVQKNRLISTRVTKPVSQVISLPPYGAGE